MTSGQISIVGSFGLVLAFHLGMAPDVGFTIGTGMGFGVASSAGSTTGSTTAVSAIAGSGVGSGVDSSTNGAVKTGSAITTSTTVVYGVGAGVTKLGRRSRISRNLWSLTETPSIITDGFFRTAPRFCCASAQPILPMTCCYRELFA